MNIEKLKFEVEEKALKLERKQNPQSCLACSCWQSGGNMSEALWDCYLCKEKKAKSDINELIKQYALDQDISYKQSWNLAKEELERLKAKKHIYFCEDYFYTDLKKYFKL